MMKRNIKLIAALAIIASISIGTVTAHAAKLSKNSTSNTTNSAHKMNGNFGGRGFGGKHIDIKSSFDALVAAGTITADQETAALNLLTPSNNGTRPDRGNFSDMLKTKLDTLVTAGTITQDQETAMINSLTPLDTKTDQVQK